jgi:hypothetical protein
VTECRDSARRRLGYLIIEVTVWGLLGSATISRYRGWSGEGAAVDRQRAEGRRCGEAVMGR